MLLFLQGMEALQASGKVKSIGVSNFSILQLERLLALCRVPPAVNQVLHIQLQLQTGRSVHSVNIKEQQFSIFFAFANIRLY